MRRPVSLLLGLSAVAALRPQLRLAARRPLAVAVRMSSQEDRPLVSSQEEEDLSKRTVVQLKEQLRAAGLPVSGRKAELVDRLLSANDPAQQRGGVERLLERRRAAALPSSAGAPAAAAAAAASRFSAGAVPAADPSVALGGPLIALPSFASSGTVVPTNTARSGRAYPPIAIEACKS